MAFLNFQYGLQPNLADVAYKQGTVYITTDTQKMYVDLPGATGQHLCLGDFQLVSYNSSITGDLNTKWANIAIKETNVLYLAVDSSTTNNEGSTLYRYTGSAFEPIVSTSELESLTDRLTTAETNIAKAQKAADDAQGSADAAQDAADEAQAAADKAQETADAAVKRAGDAMTGFLTLHAAPTDNMHAATKKYVDDQKAAADTAINGKVAKAGDTMTGHLTLNADPTAALHAATKQYVDTAEADAVATVVGSAANGSSDSTIYGAKKYTDEAKAAVIGTDDNTASVTVRGARALATAANTTANAAVKRNGDTMTGFLSLHADPTADKHAATKKYVDTAEADAVSTVVGTSNDASSANTVHGAKKLIAETQTAIVGTSTDDKNAVTVYGTRALATAAETAASNAQKTADAAVKRAGDTMTGELILHADPTKNLQAATKQYVDTAEADAISTVVGKNTDASTANTIYGAKKYTDEEVAKVNTELGKLSQDIGNLSNVMNFLGTTTSDIADGSTTKNVVIGGETKTAVAGDVVVKGNKEFVFDGDKWAEIGDVSAQSTAINDLTGRMTTAENNISGLRTDLGTNDNTSTTAFARIKELENWKATHTTEYENLDSTVDDILAILQWGCFNP